MSNPNPQTEMSCCSTVQLNACIKLLAIWKNWSPIENYESSNMIEKIQSACSW